MEFAEKTGSLLAEELSQDEQVISSFCYFTVCFQGALIIFDPTQISAVETKVDSLSEKITLCNTILQDLNELNGILVVSKFLSPFCELLNLKSILVVFHRRNLSRMCLYQNTNEKYCNTCHFYVMYI